jgi:hypothetical protein
MGAARFHLLTGGSHSGTYTFTAAWYGNRYDLSQVGGTTTFGPNWTPDPGNANHGQEKIATNSFTVTAGADTTAPTVSSTSRTITRRAWRSAAWSRPRSANRSTPRR